MKKLPLILAASLVAGGALNACSSMSTLSDDGKTDALVFANVEHAWLPQGTFPAIDSLRGVHPGMSKSQLYEMFGRPHFREGFVHVREWDYLFHFKTASGIASCQYKVVFDTQMAVRSSHWRDPACARYLEPPKPEVQIVERVVEKLVTAPTEPRRTRLAADTLFAYDKSALQDLLPGGIKRLDELVAELRSVGEFDRVSVVGHSDEIGTVDYNLALSRSRAETVRDYLAARGIPASGIEAAGLGEAVPLVQCPARPAAQRIACLAPNRRVEVETWARAAP